MFKFRLKVGCFLASFFWVLGCPANTVDTPLVLSLSGALERTLRDNKQLLISLEQSNQAQIQVRKGLAPLLPQIKGHVEQMRSRIDLNFLPETLEKTLINPVDQGNYNVSIDQVLLNPTLFATYKAYGVSAKAALQAHEAARQQLMAKTARLYFTHVRNLEKRNALQASHAQAQSLLNFATQQQQAGTANALDVLRARQRLQHEESRLVAHKATLESSLLQLQQQLNLPKELPLELPEFEIVDSQATAFLAEDLLLKKRPDFQQNVLLLEQAQLARKAAGLQYFPTVSLAGTWGFQKQKLFGGDEPANVWTMGLKLSVPIFDGFNITADKMLATSLLIERRHYLQDLKQQITREQQEAQQQVDSRVAERLSVEQEVALAQQELEAAQTLFTQGVAKHQDLLDAQTRLVEAQDSAIEAAYQHALALVALGCATGRVHETLTGCIK